MIERSKKAIDNDMREADVVSATITVEVVSAGRPSGGGAADVIAGRPSGGGAADVIAGRPSGGDGIVNGRPSVTNGGEFGAQPNCGKRCSFGAH